MVFLRTNHWDQESIGLRLNETKVLKFLFFWKNSYFLNEQKKIEKKVSNKSC